MPDRNWLFIAIALYVLSRFYLVQMVDPIFPTTGDAGHYCQIASNLAQQGVYAESGLEPTASAAWRAPLWPFVLSAWLELNPTFTMVLVMKWLFELIPLVLLYLFLKMAAFEGIALGVVLSLFAIEPQYLKYASAFLSENLTAWLLAATTAAFILTVVSNSRLATWCTAVFAALSALSHPVVFLYGFILVIIAFFHRYRKGGHWLAFASFVSWILIISAWPVRNALVFGNGLWMTTSQGAVFSKSWNEAVLTKHTNTQGDLLDEALNLKYLPELKSDVLADPIQMSAMYGQATLEFIKQTDAQSLLKMAFVKLYSGLNPIPQTNKPGAWEILGTAFRCFYLLSFILAVWSILKGSFEKLSLAWWASWLIICCFVSIAIMSIVMYTGIRFNSPYGLSLVVLSMMVFYGRVMKKTVVTFKPSNG